MPLQTRIALTRFGLGARPNDFSRVGKHGKDWLISQIETPIQHWKAAKSLKPSDVLAQDILKVRAEKRKGANIQPNAIFRKVYAEEVKQRVLEGVRSDRSFDERLVRFWSNHFSVAIGNTQTIGLAGVFEREAIRPHIYGRFEDMLLAVLRHPAMLYYLDNTASFGPNSRTGRKRGRGLNENLAREVMELHTVSLRTGYSQQDVEELAKALTGWTVKVLRSQPGAMGKFSFAPQIHEPGARTFLGKTYAAGGEEQATRMLADLVAHHATAEHIAKKITAHFISDNPQSDDVAALANVFKATNGNLKDVYLALVERKSAWEENQNKLKSVEDFILSTFRGLGVDAITNTKLAARAMNTYTSLGQVPFTAPSPQGWPDTAQAWAGPNAIQKRIEWAQQVASLITEVSPEDFFKTALGTQTGATTRQAIARAESREQGLVLALMSPEFQRR